MRCCLALLSAGFAGVAGLDTLPAHARAGALGARLGIAALPSPPAAAAAPAPAASKTFWLPVPLTYDEPERAQFKIRYHVNDEVWDRVSGPIFLEMGGEGGNPVATCTADARRHRALCLCVEHRFYGESLPAAAQGGASTQNYRKGLRVEWFLRDVAAVVDAVQRDWAGGSPRTVMNFGGSYAGATCLWFRQLFPEKTAGCVSSSGPFNILLDFPQFDIAVSKALTSPSARCAEEIHASLTAVDRAFSAGHADAIKTLFGAQNLIGSSLGDNGFKYALADGLGMIVQYGAKAEICSFASRLPSNASDDARIKNFQELLDHHFGAGFAGGSTYDSECLKRDKDFCVKKGTGAHIRGFALGGLNDRSWQFQTCNEFGFLQSAPREGGLIMRSPSITIDWLLSQCDYIFGPGQAELLREHNRKLRELFGAGEPLSGAFPETSHVLFMEYSDDPWWPASAEWKSNKRLPVCLTACDGCGHCGTGVPATGGARCKAESSQFIDQVLADAKVAATANLMELIPKLWSAPACFLALMAAVWTTSAVMKRTSRGSAADATDARYNLLAS